MFENLFKLKEAETTFKRESIAGATTFLAMAYIIVVNPAILSDSGMDKGALITATILASAFGTLLIGLWANVPIAMAPGMGLNAFFVYTLVLGKHKVSWETALGVVFISGVIFLILTLFGFRTKVVDVIPKELRFAIAAGIGVFISLIGLKNMGVIVADSNTMVTLGKFNYQMLCGIVGLIVILLLELKKVKGAIIIGIISATLLGIIFKEVHMPETYISTPPSLAPVFLKLDIKSACQLSLWGVIFAFMFTDLFDSVGTLVGCSYEAGLVEEDGKIRDIGKMLGADAIATVAGSLLGTSTTTAYIESGAGIVAGGRTGFSSVITAILFLAALIFAPLIAAVPGFATAPALVVVGIFMFKNIRKIDFSNFEIAIPSFLTIIIMPLSFSISTGLSFGFLSFIVVSLFSGKVKSIHPIMWAIGAFSALNLAIETDFIAFLLK